MYKRILVPLDGSALAEHVLDYAHLLATSLGASIELLRVVNITTPVLSPPAGWGYSNHSTECMSSQARQQLACQYLDGIRSSLGEPGLPVLSKVKEGRPAPRISLEAQKQSDTLVAMSTHGRSGLGRWMLSSVTDQVLHASTFPMLIVHPDAEKRPKGEEMTLKRVIVPLDGSPMAEQVLPHVAALARALALRVTLIRVTAPAGEHHRYVEYQPLGGGATVYFGPYEEFSKEGDAQAMEYLHEVGRRLRDQGVLSVEERLLHGHPAATVASAVHESPQTLVAMTTHGRSGVGRWVLGSVTDRVVRHCGGPVLVVRAVARTVEATRRAADPAGVA